MSVLVLGSSRNLVMRALLFPRCRCLLFQSNGFDDGPNATLDLIAPGLAAAGRTREGMTASLKGRGELGVRNAKAQT